MADYNSAYTGAQIDAAVGAVANKADDNAVVHDTGNETISGIKTFSSFPVTPSTTPSNDYQAANKKYIDDKVKTDVPVGAKFTDTVYTHPDTHGNITSDGKIGSSADLPVFTGASGAVGTKTATEAMYALVNGLSSVTPVTSDILPFKDADGSTAGYATIATILGLASGGAQIATGTYTGTGAYGSTNKNSLTFSFVPKLIVIMYRVYHHEANIPVGIVGVLMPSTGYGTKIYISADNAYTIIVSTSSYTISWYNATSTSNQLNESAIPYDYVAIG